MSDIFDYVETPLDRNFTLLEASAGTGKTFSIQRIVLRYVMQQGVPLQKILVVTFTRAATAELKSRIRSILAEAKSLIEKHESGSALSGSEQELYSILNINSQNKELQKLRIKVALMDIDLLPVYTIDSFFNRLLKDSAFENGNLFEKELLTDASLLRDEVREDFWRELLLHNQLDRNDNDDIAVHSLISETFKKENNNIVNLFNLCDRYSHFEMVGISEDSSSGKSYIRKFVSEFKNCKKVWIEGRVNISSLVDSINKKSPKDKSFAGNGIMRSTFMMDRFIVGIDEFFSGNPFGEFKDYLNNGEKIIDPNFLKENGKNPLNEQELELKALIDELRGLMFSYTELISAVHYYAMVFFRERMGRYKAERGSIYIKDLTEMLCEVLKQKSDASQRKALLEKVRSDYSVAIIDEFQDTSPQQCFIFRSLFESESIELNQQSQHPFPHLYVVGDPKQSIYRFRGADIYAYLGVSRSDTINKKKLATNYRSDPKVVEGINELFSGTSSFLTLEENVCLDVDYNSKYEEAGNLLLEGVEKPLKLVMSEDSGRVKERTLVKSVGSEIVKLLNQEEGMEFIERGHSEISHRSILPGDIAILVRTKKEGFGMLKELARRNVPAVFQGSIPVMQSEEAAAIYHMMHCILNPKNLRMIRAFMLSSLYGAKSNTELGLEEEAIDIVARAFAQTIDYWERKGFLSAVMFLDEELHLKERILDQNLGERKLTNFIHLSELLNQQEWSKKLTAHALLTWFAKEMTQSELSEDENSLRMEREGKAVRIITAHQCKGLEYPIVFCPFHGSNLTDKMSYKNPPYLWHDESSLELQVSMHKRNKPQAVLDELIDDEFRLLYVAVTRAKNLCYLYIPCLQGASPLVSLLSAKGCKFEKSKKKNKGEDEVKDKLSGFEQVKKWISTTKRIEFQSLDTNDWVYNFNVDDNPIDLHSPPELRKSYWPVNRGKCSFSMVSRGVDQQRDDDLETDSVHVEATPTNSRIRSVQLKSFRGGTKTGSMIHDTLEEILKLGWGEEENVLKKRFPISSKINTMKPDDLTDRRSANRSDVESLLRLLKVLELPDNETGRSVCLGRLSPDRCLPEIEFDFKFAGSNRTNQSIAKAIAKNNRLSSYSKQLAKLKADPGFMNGIIDLVFEQNGKFYILDWKTNSLDNYHPSALDDAMSHSHYYLQYHIYLLALHLYLKKKMSNYDYNVHFGGVYYLFLRGMSEDSENGIFFDRPSIETVNAMDEIWRG